MPTAIDDPTSDGQFPDPGLPRVNQDFGVNVVAWRLYPAIGMLERRWSVFSLPQMHCKMQQFMSKTQVL
jgi:hypothetical protein